MKLVENRKDNDMIVLIVCSGNAGYVSPFIQDQVHALHSKKIQTKFFTIKGYGLLGYLKNLSKYFLQIKKIAPDIIHAHYGLSGLLANMHRNIPVLVTYHGSDLNNKKSRFYSRFSIKLSAANIFVSQKLADTVGLSKQLIIPCGVDLNIFRTLDKKKIKKKLGLSPTKKYVLFSSRFDNEVKNYTLAKKAIEKMNRNDIEVLELKGYAREEVNEVMNAVDIALLTSYNEGSPQFIKEAMACNCPAVATDVGDIAGLFGQEHGYYLSSFDPVDVVAKLQMALEFSEKKGRTKGRDRIIKLGLDSETIAKRIIKVYESVLEKHQKVGPDSQPV